MITIITELSRLLEAGFKSVITSYIITRFKPFTCMRINTRTSVLTAERRCDGVEGGIFAALVVIGSKREHLYLFV